MTRRRIWTGFALLALTAAALFGALANRKLRWPDDPDSIQQRWETVRGWADLEAWSWDSELAAIVDGLPDDEGQSSEEAYGAAARDLLAWHALDRSRGRWRGPLDEPKAVHTHRLGVYLIERGVAGEPEALAAALHLGSRLRREGSLAHFLVGAELAERALELARESGLEPHRSALERWRPRREEVFAALAREAVGAVASMDAFDLPEPSGAFARARRALWDREVAIAKDHYARRLAWMQEVRNDLDALAVRAGDHETIDVEVWTLTPLVKLTQLSGGRVVSSFADVLRSHAAALGPG